MKKALVFFPCTVSCCNGMYAGKHFIGIPYIKLNYTICVCCNLKCYTFAFFLLLKNSKHIVQTTNKALQKHSVAVFVKSFSY